MKKCFSLIIVLAFLLSSTFIISAFKSVSTYYPEDKWRSSSPEAQGIDSSNIYNMMNYIKDRDISNLLPYFES